MTDTARPTREAQRTGPLWKLTDMGQSVWLDYIRRGILDNGELQRMIEESAVRGVTSNPAIFQQAIGQSDDYAPALRSMAAESLDPTAAYERLAIADIKRAADLFRGIYDESGGRDGFVSLEVSPELARDTQATLEEARRLWAAVDRPNLMVKIPGTPEGLPAIEESLFEGININVTLLFSLDAYQRVMERYLAALERRADSGRALDRIASVASFFVSRVDTAIDPMLEKRAAAAGDDAERARILGLRGRAAIANAKLAYRLFQETFGGERFAALQAKGARVQRPLWASTSTKNADYRDVMYVEELIGPDTVNTMPLPTVKAFADHGVVARTVDGDFESAENELRQLAEFGIGIEDVTRQLLAEGIDKFVEPFRDLLRTVESAMRA